MLASELVHKLQSEISQYGDAPIIVIGEDGEKNLLTCEPSLMFEKESIWDSRNYSYIDGFVLW